jgi:hypothetical protein
MMVLSARSFLGLLLLLSSAAEGFSAKKGFGQSAESSSSFTLFDRFRPTCPASDDSIRLFDPSLLFSSSNNNDDIWVAVYRSNNNKPSVLVKDEFLHAMRSATTQVNATPARAEDASLQASFEGLPQQQQQAPVAVARLRPSTDMEGCTILDSMRCVLKKENTDAACDGGSEHTEALAVGIDALLLHYLSENSRFEGAIRTKATLVAAALLESRGFVPVQELSKDMTTHVASLDSCLERYAERTMSAKSPGALQRALDIVSCLGRLNRQEDYKAAQQQQQDNQEEEDFDPWSGMKRFV